MTGFLNIPPRLNKLMSWFDAMWAWDWGDPIPLSHLIRTEPIPEEFREAIADIVTGNRVQRRNWRKSKIPAAKRMEIAGVLSVTIELFHIIKANGKESIERVSEEYGEEPIDVIRMMEGRSRRAKSETANRIGVSEETVENLLREMRDRIERWPVV